MPYRRLPNTDAARLRAMQEAYKMGQELSPRELAFTQSTYVRLGLFITSFENAVSQYRQAYKAQSDSSASYQAVSRRARLYVSHFIQVVDMAILRGELKEDIRAIYGLDALEGKHPPLASEPEVMEWGQRIINGEMARTSQGHTPIMNPTIAMVRVHYEAFKESYQRQRVLQQNTARTLNALNEIRITADTIIRSIWDEVESHFIGLSDSERRRRATQYGIIYIYRKNELAFDGEEAESLLSPETESLFQELAATLGAKEK